MEERHVECWCNDQVGCPFCEAGFEQRVIHVIYSDGKGKLIDQNTYEKLIKQKTPKKKKRRKPSNRIPIKKMIETIASFGIEHLENGKPLIHKQPQKFQCYCGEKFDSIVKALYNRRVKCCEICYKKLHTEGSWSSADSSITLKGLKYLSFIGRISRDLHMTIEDAVKYAEENKIDASHTAEWLSEGGNK